MLADAQTSGGLLLSVPNKHLKEILQFLNESGSHQTKVIGKFIPKKDKNIIVNNE